MLDKKDIINFLKEIATCLELLGENPFKSNSYRKAVRTIENTDDDIIELIKHNHLTNLKGIGKAISEKIYDLFSSGSSLYLKELKEKIPDGIFDILKLKGLGTKKVKELWDFLEITNITELEYACNENRLVLLKGFGEKTQTNVLNAINKFKEYKGWYLYSEAEKEVERLIQLLSKNPNIERLACAGDFRRGMPIINTIILVAGTNKPNLDITIESNFNVDIKITKEFYTTLFKCTGSEEHVKSTEISDIQNQNSENDIYSSIGLSYIEPELRENNGEIEASKNNQLPILIKNSDIKGIIHTHSTYSDGSNSIEEMACECIEQGYEYLGITDHSKSAFYAGGLTDEEIVEQHNEIIELNKKYAPFKIFHGIESDILKNGSLDYPDEILSIFDFVIASVHSVFNLPENEMTKRIIKAIRNPYTTILGHPTGRLLLGREAYNVNMDEILNECVKTNTVIEINANPHRLDLDWKYHKKAKEMGVLFAINPDAHSSKNINHVKYGVITARKGWLEKTDIINSFNVKEITNFFNDRHP